MHSVIVFVCTGRGPQQKNASITPGWTPIPTPTRTFTTGRLPLWTSQKRVSPSPSPRARLHPPSWTSSGRISGARGKVSWRQAAMPSPSASPLSARGPKSSRSWFANWCFTGGKRLGKCKLHGPNPENLQTLGFDPNQDRVRWLQYAWLFLLLQGLWAELCIVWYLCVWAFVTVLNYTCYSLLVRMIVQKECERAEDAGQRSGREQGLCCRTALLPYVMNLNSAQLNTGWFTPARVLLLYPVSLLDWVSEERWSPTSLDDFPHCVLSSKQVVL